jgi:sporulation protein YlmC with PRC-barrel domain
MLRSGFRVVCALAAAAALGFGQDETLRVSQILKMEVRSASNQTVGAVKDVVIDPRAGGISYAIVSLSRLPEKAGKLFAVPWQALTPSSDRKALVLAVSNETLAQVPGFEPNLWPDLSDPLLGARIIAAWGVRLPGAVWPSEADEPRVIGTLSTAPLGTSLLRLPKRALVTGTVESFFPSGELSEAVIVTEGGAVETVLGPLWFLEAEQLAFDENVNVRLKGRTEVIDGRPMFVATEAMTHPGRWVRLRYDDLTPAWREGVEYPFQVRYLSGTVEYASEGVATVLTPEGLRTVAIAPSNYFSSRHWRIRLDRRIGVTGYDDPVTRQFVAILVDHENETWRVRHDDGRPLWRDP